MTEAEYIEKVKVKLDEVSPFNEPSTFIASGGDASYDDVKPIIAYITSELPNAVKFCLSSLPYSILAKDIDNKVKKFTLTNRVGLLPSDESCDFSVMRLVRVSVSDYWDRDVTSFITSEDAAYLVQQNKNTRAKLSKPVVAYSAEHNRLELYSFPLPLLGEVDGTSRAWDAIVCAIDTSKSADQVLSPIEDFIVIKCAQQVLDILGNSNGASLMEKEYQRKLSAL